MDVDDTLNTWVFFHPFRVAGSDTTSTTMAYMFWELSRRPDIMKKLQAEMDEAMADAKVVPDISVLQELPYLSAFMKEGTSSTKKNYFQPKNNGAFILSRPSLVHCCAQPS
jgi:hypothetical protein